MSEIKELILEHIKDLNSLVQDILTSQTPEDLALPFIREEIHQKITKIKTLLSNLKRFTEAHKKTHPLLSKTQANTQKTLKIYKFLHTLKSDLSKTLNLPTKPPAPPKHPHKFSDPSSHALPHPHTHPHAHSHPHRKSITQQKSTHHKKIKLKIEDILSFSKRISPTLHSPYSFNPPFPLAISTTEILPSVYKYPFPTHPNSYLHYPINKAKRMPAPFILPKDDIKVNVNTQVSVHYAVSMLPFAKPGLMPYVHYTLDGSLPTAFIGEVYSEESKPVIKSNVNFRCVLCAPGFMDSEVVTRPFIVDQSDLTILNARFLSSAPMPAFLPSANQIQAASSAASKNMQAQVSNPVQDLQNDDGTLMRPSHGLNIGGIEIGLGIDTPQLGKETPVIMTPSAYYTPSYTPSYVNTTPLRRGSAYSSSSESSSD
jgi:hypothetical protein